MTYIIVGFQEISLIQFHSKLYLYHSEKQYFT